MECIFCQIIAGRIESSVVYQDERVVAILDVRPINPGHTLVIPREHADHLATVDNETGTRMFQAAKLIASALRTSGLKCEGVNLLLADGRAAGQEIFHTHLHVIPRFSGDGFRIKFEKRPPPDRENLNQIAAQIQKTLPRGYVNGGS